MSKSMFRAVMQADKQAARVVPPSGVTARLTVFVSATMAFLAVFALAVSMAAGRVADRWAEGLAQSATLRINAPQDQKAAQTAAAIAILQQTPGVAEARPLTPDEQAQLLAPWFGPDPILDGLPVPQLIEVTATAQGYDVEGLQQRLRGEIPGAVLDDHGRFREPLVRAADALRLVSYAAITLIGATMAAMITLAANASLAANAKIIEVLRLVGARDGFIAQGFVRRFTWRGFVGSALGAALGVLCVSMLPDPGDQALLSGLGFQGLDWLAPALVPIVSAVVAFVATLGAAQRKLRGLV